MVIVLPRIPKRGQEIQKGAGDAEPFIYCDIGAAGELRGKMKLIRRRKAVNYFME